jgi:triosephosphate isomerase
MIPLVCVGETTRESADDAARVVLAQAEAVLASAPPDAELAFAYEPVWAIGAERPADPAWVTDVAGRLRARLADREARPRLVYGGSAGPGLYGRLATVVDGLFLGRFAHDTENLRAVLAEVEAGADEGGRREASPDGGGPSGAT